MMMKPTHLGKIVRQELEALDMTITAAADALGVSRQQLAHAMAKADAITVHTLSPA